MFNFLSYFITFPLFTITISHHHHQLLYLHLSPRCVSVFPLQFPFFFKSNVMALAFPSVQRLLLAYSPSFTPFAIVPCATPNGHQQLASPHPSCPLARPPTPPSPLPPPQLQGHNHTSPSPSSLHPIRQYYLPYSGLLHN